MEFRFTLIDRYNNRTRIDEPMGWDSFSIRIKRHAERHGTFRELQGNNFQFIDKAVGLLKAEYDEYGIRGNYRMQIDWKCNKRWAVFYTGIIAFDSYKYICGTTCSVTVEIEQEGPLVTFLNRFDQKVDLGNPLAFDGVTALEEYTHLKKEIVLPSKAIVVKGMAGNTAKSTYRISDDAGFAGILPAGTGTINGAIRIPFPDVQSSTIQDFETASAPDFINNSQLSQYIREIVYNNPEQSLGCTSNKFKVSYRVKGRYIHSFTGVPSGQQTLYLVLRKGPNTFTDAPNNTSFVEQNLFAPFVYRNIENFTQEFDSSFASEIDLDPGEKLWLNLFLVYDKFTNFTPVIDIEFDAETSVNISTISKCEATTGNVYLINETASRVIEAITNNQLKLYSEHLGRPDSQPFSFAEPGCGAMEGVTVGLEIRKAKLADGSDPKIFLSIKDIFDDLSASHNIGLGMEGLDKIRIENWKWFYQNQLIHECKGVDKVEEAPRLDWHFSIFKSGYEKWEAEDFNGLDEFLTSREYRLDVTNIQNTLEKVCKWIASGYAWEVTRRKQGDDKDWRYDNDTFVVCLSDRLITPASFTSVTNSFNVIVPEMEEPFKIGDQIEIEGTDSNNVSATVINVLPILNSFQVFISVPVTSESASEAVFRNLSRPFYSVEVANIEDPENIIDPDTVYNFRRSPVRIAMRWFDRLAMTYRHVSPEDKILFSKADGNYVAKGFQRWPDCRPETAAIAENADISLSSFDEDAAPQPIVFADFKNFKFPLSAADFKKISANIYGVIGYQSGCETGYGWIEELEYYPNEGQAKWNLIPAVSDFVPVDAGIAGGIYEIQYAEEYE